MINSEMDLQQEGEVLQGPSPQSPVLSSRLRDGHKGNNKRLKNEFLFHALSSMGDDPSTAPTGTHK